MSQPGRNGRCDAVVINLKTRSWDAEAIKQSWRRWYMAEKQGCQLSLFTKYYHFRSSTAEGNIGPVTDALMVALDTCYVISPALPG